MAKPGAVLSPSRLMAIYNSPMRSLILQGVPGASVLRQLQEGGIGYRKQDFYEDVRRMSGYRSTVERLKDANPLRRITKAMTIPPKLGASQRYKYQSRVRLDHVDKYGNVIESRFRIVNSSALRSPKWMKDQAMADAEEKGKSPIKWKPVAELELVSMRE